MTNSNEDSAAMTDQAHSVPRIRSFSEAGEAPKRRLGRGLSALLGDAAPQAAESPSEAAAGGPRGVHKVPIEMVAPNPANPRRAFAEAELAELAASIRERGIVQPILVRPRGEGRYEIIAGERRWRAAALAQAHEVPVVVREATDGEALELAIIENVQRSDLNPIEEAEGYRRLMDEFGYGQEELAGVIGKSRSHVANTLRLLRLSPKLRAEVEAGRLTAGHARAVLAASDPEAFAARILAEDLSVRAAEALLSAPEAARRPRKPAPPPPAKDADTRALERRLEEALGLKVTIAHRPDETGELRIAYASLEQLDEACRRLLGG